MENYDSILERAFEYGKSQHPDAPAEHHAAFANSVAYAMTGASGGYGGPSMREHLASRLVISKFGAGANRIFLNRQWAMRNAHVHGGYDVAEWSVH